MIGSAVALLAVIVSCGIYLYIAQRVAKNVRAMSDYLPLKRTLSAAEYRGTTVAAGMSLATVVIALLNLGPVFGISLVITVATYCIGFLVLLRFVDRIMDRNPENLALPEYLSFQYGSPLVGRVAGVFVFLGYLSIFAMELLVGVTVMEPFFPNTTLAFAAIYFVFLVVYTWLSGFKGIVATDVWQLRFVWASLLALVIFFVVDLPKGGGEALLKLLHSDTFTSWKAPLSFCLGIAVMNIPAPLSDTSTWQRVCATVDVESARRGLRGAIASFTVLWGAIILLGIILPTAQLDPALSKLTLIGQVLGTMGGASKLPIQLLLFVFVLGLFSAMVSTADSLLLAATHVSLPMGRVKALQGDGHQLRLSRYVMVTIASTSFALFVGFRLLGFDVVQLVFAIYGAQLALFPAVFLTLSDMEKSRVQRASRFASISITVGFAAAWGSALFGRLGENPNAMFFAPVVALIGAALVLAPVFLGGGR